MKDGTGTIQRLTEQVAAFQKRIAELEESEKRHRLTEEALRDSENRHRCLFEDVPMGLYRTTAEGQILDANPALVRMLGYPNLESLLSVNASNLYKRPEDRLRWQSTRVCEESIPDFETQMCRNDGSTIWVRDFSRAVRGPDDEVLHYEGSLEDITERKLAVDALRQSEKRYRSLVETLHEGLVIADADENINFANFAFCKMIGYSKDEIYGLNMRDIVREESFQKILEETSKRKRGISSQYEIEIVQKGGETRNIRVSAAPGVDETGEFEWAVGIFLDITEQKRAQEALRSSEEKYRTLTENVNLGVYRNTIGPKGRFIEANPAVVRIFGYDNKTQFLNTPVADLYQNSKDRLRFNEKMLSVGFVKDEELSLMTKKGLAFIASVSAVAVKAEDGSVMYYDGIIEDITERKEAEELRLTFERLQLTLDGTVHALAATSETADPYTAGHQQRVAQLASAIAKEMGLSENTIDSIIIAATLHDLGKIYVPPSILSRPGKLADIEFNLIKAHPTVGHDILKTVAFPWPIAEMVYQHQERLDGSGYPRGLAGEELMLEARILGVADVVEAMSSHRPYRSALGIDAALKEIEEQKGILYDPDVVEACLKLFRDETFSFDRGQR